MLKTIVARQNRFETVLKKVVQSPFTCPSISRVALLAVLALIGSAVPAHAELVVSPEDPSVVLALVGAGAAALPFAVVGVRAYLKNKRKQ
jgi:hypothetical protein